MPEINLELLKSRKKSAIKYRPYDFQIPIPDKNTEEKNGNDKKNAKSSHQQLDCTEEKDVIKTHEIDLSINNNHNEQELFSRHNTENNNNATSRDTQEELDIKRGNINPIVIEEIVTTTNTASEKFSFNDIQITPYELFDLLKYLKKFTASDINYLMCVLELTNFGQLIDVHIKKEDFEKHGVPSGKLNDARINFGHLVEWRWGRHPGSKSKPVHFYRMRKKE